MLQQIVIVGAGQAAVQVIDTLRRRGFSGSLALIGDEPDLPYQRPPLSKKYLAGSLARERLLLRPPQFYADHAVQAYLGRRAVRIDRHAQRVWLDDGAVLSYDALLLATGGRARVLPLPGADLAGVHTLRCIADVDRLRSELRPAARLVIVGGGYIGLEVAATCRALGLEVTVLEMADRLMSRVVCPTVSAFYEAQHIRQGVRIVCNARVSALACADGAARVCAVQCEDGSAHPADIVLVAAGVVPAQELASVAGLECANGIVIDEYCRTSDPHIFAAGDCSNQPSPHYGRRVRLESVDNAFEQGTSAALNLLGIATVHDKVPWFWSDQFDLKLVIIGLSQGHDRVVMRGAVAARSFSACYLRAGELLAVDTVNSAADHIAARRLIAARARPDLKRLANADIPLKECSGPLSAGSSAAR